MPPTDRQGGAVDESAAGRAQAHLPHAIHAHRPPTTRLFFQEGMCTTTPQLLMYAWYSAESV
eukprot:31042-Eustigmatos_ZCMA.PRE.1